MARAIDLNCDLGESYGPWVMGNDEAMMDIVSSVNVACGFHGGDPQVMAATCARAKAKSVSVGAHPGYHDKEGFGRRVIPMGDNELETMVAYQIGALQAIAARAGTSVVYVKPHGALNNAACRDPGMAKAISKAIKAVDPSLVFLATAGTEIERAGRDTGLTVAAEIFADRAYEDDGQLRSRALPGALLHDADVISQTMVDAVTSGHLTSINGKPIAVGMESICVHGDNKTAVAIAGAVRKALEGAGIAVSPFAKPA